MIRALDNPIRECLCGDMLPFQVATQRTKERNTIPNEHWERRDDQFVDQVGSQEPLDCLSTINVDSLAAHSAKALQYSGRLQREDLGLPLQVRRDFIQSAAEDS